MMAKIGRNDRCPCRSGKKYKHCCAGKEAGGIEPPQETVTLMGEVRKVQEDALAKRVAYREVGVFFFFSTAAGDAWLLEMTERDCLQVARAGEFLPTPIDEGPQTIEINYSHMFAIDNRQLIVMPYNRDSEVVGVLADAPCQELHAAMRRIERKLSSGQLQNVHLDAPDVSGA